MKLENGSRISREIKADGKGPTYTLLKGDRNSEEFEFDRIFFLNNYGQENHEMLEAFAEWVGFPSAEVINTQLDDPSDHEEIWNIASNQINYVKEQFIDPQISIFLSPGTPAMHAIWLYAGQTLCSARFLEAYRPTKEESAAGHKEGRVTETHLPFSLSKEVLEKGLNETDKLISTPQRSEHPPFFRPERPGSRKRCRFGRTALGGCTHYRRNRHWKRRSS